MYWSGCGASRWETNGRELISASAFGVITCQYGGYLSMYGDDHRWIRVVCLVVWLATALKAVLDSASAWLIFVPTSRVAGLNCAQLGSFIVFHVIVGVAQSFFIARVARLYRTAWVAVPACLLLAGSMGSGMYAFAVAISPVVDQTHTRLMRGMLSQMCVRTAAVHADSAGGCSSPPTST